jgi:hypothetical protein
VDCVSKEILYCVYILDMVFCLLVHMFVEKNARFVPVWCLARDRAKVMWNGETLLNFN